MGLAPGTRFRILEKRGEHPTIPPYSKPCFPLRADRRVAFPDEKRRPAMSVLAMTLASRLVATPAL